MFNITRYYVEVKEDKLKQRAWLTVSGTTMIFFMRYGIVRKGRESDYLCHFPGEELQWQSPAAPRFCHVEDAYLSPKDVPSLPPYGFAYAAFPLRSGYLYAYYETDDKWMEFRISGALELQKIDWDGENKGKDDRRIKWNSKIGSVEGYKGLPVGKNKVVWVAYSEVQWSAAYAQKVLTTPSLREGRMQRIDVGKWQEGATLDDEFDLTKSPFFAYPSDSSELEELRIKTNALIKQDKEAEEFPDFVFMLHDPLGAVDDVATCLQKEYDYLDALAACAPLGEDPRKMKKDEQRRFSSTLEDDKRQEEYEALFSTGLTLYLSLFNKVGKKGNPDLEKYRQQLDVNRLRAMLGVEKRAKQRKVIQGIREVMGSLIHSNYYQNVLFDYSENCLQFRLDGETRIASEHYGLLADLPRFHDCHLDLYTPQTQQEDDWRNLVAAYFSGETLANPSGLLSPQWQYRKQGEAVQAVSYRLHHKDYGTGSVSSLSRIAFDKLITNLLVALGLYGPFVGTKLKHEQLVSKLNRLKIDTEDLVVLKDKSIGRIMDELKEDLKKIRNKSRKIRKERGAEFRARAEGSIARLEKSNVITLKHANEEIRQTRARVLELLKERKRFSPDNEMVALLGELQVAINAVNVGWALGAVIKENSFKDQTNLASSSFALLSSTLSLSTESMRMLDLRLTRLFFKKNIHIRFSTRLSWVASILSAAVDGISTYERFKNRDYNAGLCYALAAASGVGVTVGAVAAIWFSALWGGPLAWAFVAVGFSTGILAEMISKDDFELFLSNSVFGKELLPSVRAHPNAGIAGPDMRFPIEEGLTEGLSGKLPHEVMEMLYAHGNKLNKTLDISGEKINMGAFKEVEGWLREFFLRKKESCAYRLFEIDTKKVPSRVLGIDYQKTTVLDKLCFSCSFAIPKPATIAAECVLYLYLVHVENKSALIEITPYDDLKVTKDISGELYTFDVRFPAISKRVCEFVMDKEWDPYIRWYDYVDRSRSCYFLTYRIYTDMDDKENYMPYNEEWYVRTLPFIDYQEGAQLLNALKKLTPKSYEEFEELKNKNRITLW